MTDRDSHHRHVAIFDFLQEAEKLKDTLRSACTTSGRPESTAEHSWRLCLMVILFEADLADVDLLRVLKLCVLHDLGEALGGDVPAPDQTPDAGRMTRERQDLISLCRKLPAREREALLTLWDEYAEAATPEARLAKGLDKLETMMQHLLDRNGARIDYPFNLTYGRTYTDQHPLLSDLRRIVDSRTADRIEANLAPCESRDGVRSSVL